jgi:hypothetical protein
MIIDRLNVLLQSLNRIKFAKSLIYIILKLYFSVWFSDFYGCMYLICSRQSWVVRIKSPEALNQEGMGRMKNWVDI